jgi:hypothetical protein
MSFNILVGGDVIKTRIINEGSSARLVIFVASVERIGIMSIVFIIFGVDVI